MININNTKKSLLATTTLLEKNMYVILCNISKQLLLPYQSINTSVVRFLCITLVNQTNFNRYSNSSSLTKIHV